MTRDEYCLDVCGGKCCTIKDEDGRAHRCKHQDPNGTCGIYDERFAAGRPDFMPVYWYPSRVGIPIMMPFVCGRIEKVIEKGYLPDHIAKGCCYVHPELLEEKKP